MFDQVGETRRTPQEAALELERIEAEQARRSLHKFITLAWKIVEPDKPFVDNWHIHVLCWLLESITEGKPTEHLERYCRRRGVDPTTLNLSRVLVNVAPGSMKSLLVNVFWPAWEWTRRPQLRFLTFSYGGHLTIRDNLRTRDIVQSAWYRSHYGVEFHEDQNQKTRFDTEAGGWRIASSVGGVGTGEHPDRIIIDDPLTSEQARSPVEREGVNTWFDLTVSTRGVARDTVIIVIMQRLHEEDLSGHLESRGGWLHICWPMRYETTRKNKPEWKPDVLDPRSEAGDLFWPTLFTEKKVRQLEIDLGPYGTAGQLQQRPAPEGGGLFKREYFRFLEAMPAVVRKARGWDTAATEQETQRKAGGPDYTRGVGIGETVDGKYIVFDVVGGRLSPAGVDALMLQTGEHDGFGVMQREEREGGSAGKYVIAAHAKMMHRFDYAGVVVGTDKVTRSMPFRAQCEAGNVYLLRAAWNEEYIRELCDFPTGDHDDQVDGSSAAYNALVKMPAQRKATWGRA